MTDPVLYLRRTTLLKLFVQSERIDDVTLLYESEYFANRPVNRMSELLEASAHHLNRFYTYMERILLWNEFPLFNTCSWEIIVILYSIFNSIN